MGSILASDLKALGLESQSVCLHSSMKSFRESVRPDEVINAFLEIDSTLLVPTMAWSHFSAPKPESDELRPFNAEMDGSIPTHLPISGFSQHSNLVGPAMGILPKTLVSDFSHFRGNHPLASFAASGSRSEELIHGQSPENPLSPLEMLAQMQGHVLLMGTDLTSATILHLAEEKAGLPGLVRWAMLEGGEVVTCNVTGCSRGFERLQTSLSSIERRRIVRGSEWRIYPAQEMLHIATQYFREFPLGGICNFADCVRCQSRREYIVSLQVKEIDRGKGQEN